MGKLGRITAETIRQSERSQEKTAPTNPMTSGGER